MPQAIRIEGVDDCLKMFDNAPENSLKICRKAFKSASRATAKHISKGIPKRFRKLVRPKVGKTATGNIYARIGLYNGKQASGKQPKDGKTFDWFKAYWANYGTLSRRDPSHHFEYKIKPKSRYRRQSVGQPALNFYDRSIVGWEDVFTSEFEKTFNSSSEELYNR